MTKHIHIHVHRVSARDTFEESKHKRGEGGRFATTGSAGGNAEHHTAQSAAHTKASGVANSSAQYNQHAAAARSHSAAAHYLKRAEALSATGKHSEAKSLHELANVHALGAAEAEKNVAAMKATPLSQSRPNSSGVEVKHQPSGTPVKHQAPKTGLLPPKSEPLPGGHKVTYGPEHVHALKDVLPQERANRLPSSGSTNLSYEQHEQMLKRHFS